MDEDTEGMQFDVSSSESDVDEDESRGSFPRARIHVEQCTTGEPKEREPREPNPLRQLVLNAVLDALRIVKESGLSCQTLLLASRDSQHIDREILLTLWPRNWNSVQKLLKEEGYEDAKLLFICICRNEKEQTRNGKTS